MRPRDTQHVISDTHYTAIVIGGSAGGGVTISEILSMFPCDFPVPILVVQHLHPSDGDSFAQHLARSTPLRVVVPCDKQRFEPGCVYVAPSNYHMLVEREGTVALSIDERVNWSRPSIDVLFESAAHACGARLIAVILSGANHDGAHGMRTVKECGGLTIAQSADSAESPVMPQAAIDASDPDYIESPEDIARLLIELGTRRTEGGDT